MSLTFTGTGGLFTRLGKVGKLLGLINTHETATLRAMVPELVGTYDSLRGVPAALPQQLNTMLQGAENSGATLKDIAQQTVIQMVAADVPAKAGSLAAALAEVIRQMGVQSKTVSQCTVGVTPTAISGGHGNAMIVTTTKRGDGKVQENIVPETAVLVCTGDSQGSATLGQEVFQFAGAADAGNVYSDLWPTGSAGNVTINAADATVDNAGGNVLSNSAFETFSANVPAKWLREAGTAGTDFQASTGTFYSGSKCLEIIGGGANPSFSQRFGDATNGTAGTLTASKSYAVNFVIKADVVPTSGGTLKVQLVGGADESSLAVLADDNSVNNELVLDLTTDITTSFAAHSVVFRTPKAMPAVVRLRLVVTATIDSGSNIFIDHLCMTPITAAYAGGYGIAIFSGSTKTIVGDGWTIAATNDRASATYNQTFQALFDRLFGMRALGLLLPSSGSPNVADTLITS